MTQMRYWAMTVGVGVCGGFIAIARFAFAPGDTVWIAFGVAIAAVFFAAAAVHLALAAQDPELSGLSMLSASVAGWTVIATRTFTSPTSLWLSLAGGAAMVLASVWALALREATIRAEARTWIDWLAHTCLAVAGAFVVLSTYAWTPTGQAVSPRWLAFAIGIAALVVLAGSVLARRRERGVAPRASVALTGASAAVAIALVATMAALHDADARWTAFALGCAMVGISLLASAINERTTQPIRRGLVVTRTDGAADDRAAEAA